MKLENIQSYVTNLQFAGGQNIGSGSAGNASKASGSLNFANLITQTGSFWINDAYGEQQRYYLTSSAVSSVSGSDNFIPLGASNATAFTNIINFLNASASAVVTIASGSAQTGSFTSTLNGTFGNLVNIVYGAQKQSVLTLAGGTGLTDFPYTIPFVAGGLYVGGAGTLVATTADGSVLQFVSASGFIPGLFTAVSSGSTATNIVALK